MFGPASVDEDGLAFQVEISEAGCIYDGLGLTIDLGINADARELGEGFQGQLGEVFALGVAVEGAVQVGAGGGDEFDFADVEAGVGTVELRSYALTEKPGCDQANRGLARFSWINW